MMLVVVVIMAAEAALLIQLLFRGVGCCCDLGLPLVFSLLRRSNRVMMTPGKNQGDMLRWRRPIPPRAQSLQHP